VRKPLLIHKDFLELTPPSLSPSFGLNLYGSSPLTIREGARHLFFLLSFTLEAIMTTATSRPITAAQKSRLEAMAARGIFTGAIPTTSWEASWAIRTSPASKRDKEGLAAKGGRVLARMTSSEMEMTSKVLTALDKLSRSGSKDELVMEAEILLRSFFCAKSTNA